jgi:hypothetical protein
MWKKGGSEMNELPKWIDDLDKTVEIGGSRAKLIEALTIAWKVLRHIEETPQCELDCDLVSRKAMRRIEEVWK